MTVFSWDSKLIEDLDLSEYGLNFEKDFSPTKPEEGITVRPLSRDDYQKGFPDVISFLTKVGTVSEKDFCARFDSIKAAGDYYTIVIEDVNANNGNGKIIATGTLEIEQKYIHSCALRGRIEEVVVDEKYRGRKFGKLVLGILTALSKKLNCYKTTLECKEENVDFYGIFGYKEDPEKFMQLRFRD